MRTYLVALLLLVACKSAEDYKNEQHDKEPPPAEKAAPPLPPPPKKALTPDQLGTCTLEVSGGVTGKQTSKGGREATNVSYWYSPEERKAMMGIDGFVVRCEGDQVRFAITPAGGKPDAMPFKPKKYEFKKGKSDGASVSFAFNDKRAMTGATGAVDVTAFDTHHIAGTVELAGKLSPGGGDVKVSGTFDLICPGLKNCDK